jgi:hypothetical protein
LDTSFEECVVAVKQRRSEREDGREFKLKNITQAYKGFQRVRRTLIQEDVVRCMDISRQNGLQVILQLLEEA